MSYSIFERIDIREKFSFVKCVEPFFFSHNGMCSSQRRFGSLLLRSRDRNRWPFMSLIVGLLTNTSRWQPTTEGHFRHGWFLIDAKKRETIWKYRNLFKFYLRRWVIFPYYVLSNAVPPPPPAMKHIGLFLWVKFVSLAGKAFPFHMVRIANLVVSEVANIIVWYHRI